MYGLLEHKFSAENYKKQFVNGIWVGYKIRGTLIQQSLVSSARPSPSPPPSVLRSFFTLNGRQGNGALRKNNGFNTVQFIICDFSTSTLFVNFSSTNFFPGSFVNKNFNKLVSMNCAILGNHYRFGRVWSFQPTSPIIEGTRRFRSHKATQFNFRSQSQQWLF